MRRPRRRWPLVTGAVVLLVAGALSLVWFVLLPDYRPGLREGEVYGIDVSRHQGEVDWQAVAGDDIAFAYVKASEGGDLVDRRFAENWRGAGEAGLQRGAYHYFTLCRPAADQAAHFLSVAPPDPEALPPAVDLEFEGNCSARPSVEDLMAEVDLFLRTVEAAWGREVLVYTNDRFADAYPVRGLDRERWEVGHYRRPDQPWLVWQVTPFAEVDGVEGGVDLDVMRAP